MKKWMIRIISLMVISFSSFSCTASNDTKSDIQVSEIEVDKEYSVVILGGGIGALTSGIYLARAGYQPLIIEGELPGGLITQSHSVENWPGETQISGTELVDKIKEQAKKNGCIFLSKKVVDIDFSKKPTIITLEDSFRKDKVEKIKATSCVIAMGTSSNYLNIPGEKLYWGNGVSNCAICDGSFYKDKTVAIIGGGDAAVVEANYLSKLCRQVYILVRKDVLRAKDKEKIKALEKRQNVEVIYNTNVTEINGDNNHVRSVTIINNKNNDRAQLDVDGVFLAIGSKPNSTLFKNKIKLDAEGYIKVADDKQTSAKGVFAIGDIIDPIYKQAITAAGDGAKAAITCQKYLENFDTPKQVIKFAKAGDIESPRVIEINSYEQFEKEIQSGVPVIIDFYASWCGPCKRIAPLIEDKAKILSGKVKILKVNVEKFRNISSKYQITAMPTIIVIDQNSNYLFKRMGPESISDIFNSLEKIKDKSPSEIENYLKSLK